MDDGQSQVAAKVLNELQALDRAVYVAIADTPTPLLDQSIRHLSDAANYSKIWIVAAAGLAAVGGPTGRRAAVTGLIAIGAASLIVNQGVKRVADRERPDRDTDSLPDAREAKMPDSTSTTTLGSATVNPDGAVARIQRHGLVAGGSDPTMARQRIRSICEPAARHARELHSSTSSGISIT